MNCAANLDRSRDDSARIAQARHALAVRKTPPGPQLAGGEASVSKRVIYADYWSAPFFLRLALALAFPLRVCPPPRNAFALRVRSAFIFWIPFM